MRRAAGRPAAGGLQHLVEVGTVCIAGSLLGLGLAALGLRALQHMYAAARFGRPGGYQELMHLDTSALVWALLLAVLAAPPPRRHVPGLACGAPGPARLS